MRNFFLLLNFALILQVLCDEHDHVYRANAEVVLWMNTVGPYSNRQETYNYFSLPFCKGYKTTIEHYHETLGEALLGVELEFSGLDIRFNVEQPKTEYCKKTLSSNEAEAMIFAVEHNYWYQMYIDELPLLALVGEKDNGTAFIYTHKKFEIGYNGNQIVLADVVAESRRELKPNQELSFTYEVSWKQSDVNFDKRFEVFNY
uniref:Transmembrane 9 superfamily member n=1 Tax=Globodera pallida TaxID=36090 RepID=A0A183CK20_GLOPA